MSDTHQSSATVISRRKFIKTTVGATLATILSASGDAQAQRVGDDLTKKIKNAVKNGDWTDQYGEKFDMASLEGKAYIQVFGRNSCQFCSMISQTIKRLKDSGKVPKDMPIVVVDILPEKDGKKIPEFVADYTQLGIAGDFEKDRGTLQKNRNFHIVFAPKNFDAQKLEDDFNVIRNVTDETSHGMRIAVIDKNGKCEASQYAASTDPASQKKVDTILLNAIEKVTASIVR